jgi:hypothetical protein
MLPLKTVIRAVQAKSLGQLENDKNSRDGSQTRLYHKICENLPKAFCFVFGFEILPPLARACSSCFYLLYFERYIAKATIYLPNFWKVGKQQHW